jgi:hypothetical protein
VETTVAFRMIPTDWTSDWHRFLGKIRNFAITLDFQS